MERKLDELAGTIGWPVPSNCDRIRKRSHTCPGENSPKSFALALPGHGDTAPEAGLLLSSDIETE